MARGGTAAAGRRAPHPAGIGAQGLGAWPGRPAPSRRACARQTQKKKKRLERGTRGRCVPRVLEALTARAIWLCKCAQGWAGLGRFPSGAVRQSAAHAEVVCRVCPRPRLHEPFGSANARGARRGWAGGSTAFHPARWPMACLLSKKLPRDRGSIQPLPFGRGWDRRCSAGRRACACPT
ncbi:hypothetical protein NDU88_000740 [Pleurodeles waltl]|uniref:SRCR domain-containing protein n=1 Tax=Pleurodeles waltl TaxID=8319 RepID=A0AAV7R523_PLEWA|nr:hypothetical protein NDU88_000740 [Pleurodeles waltl]